MSVALALRSSWSFAQSTPAMIAAALILSSFRGRGVVSKASWKATYLPWYLLASASFAAVSEAGPKIGQSR